MDVSGTLHFYSGDDDELFFVFDDDVAQEMYASGDFDIDDLESRRVYISVGTTRFIHRRALSFSRKQTEIKVSLCSRATKDGLNALTSLYDWFASRGGPRPRPFPLLGTLAEVSYAGETVLELRLTEPADLAVVPPGLPRRRKTKSRVRRSFEHRRKIVERDLAEVGGPAEELALLLAQADYSSSNLACLWRGRFLDSERIEIRRMGVIADIDVWDVSRGVPHAFIEVKAQKVSHDRAKPAFYLSVAEWRGYEHARKAGVPYHVWLFQYRDLMDFRRNPERVELVLFTELKADWRTPDGFLVTPESGFGTRYTLE